MVERPSLREILPPTADDDRCRAALVAPRDEGHAPWYVLVGFGAWVSAILFVIAALVSGIADSRAALGALGLTAFAVGVILRRSARSDFPVQLALAMSLGGRVTLYTALFERHEPTTVVWAVALALEILSVAAYADAVGRFLATLGACSALVGLTDALHLPWPAMPLATLVIAAGATAIWQREPALLARGLASIQRPVGFGLVVALMTALLADLWTKGSPDRGRFSVAAVGLTLLLLVVEREALRRALAHARPRGGYRAAAPRDDDPSLPAAPAPPETRAIVYGGTIAIGALGQLAPGLMGALLVMALGAHRRNRLLFALAAAFLIFFGSHFYYNLSMTLLAKSGVLLGSGLLMLGLRLPLARRAS